MIKAIVLVRTSTVRQEIDSQIEEVIKYALSDGYSIDEITVIGGAGSSAIKLDERYMENINRVYDLINCTPSIECVYAWAIDRIGRKEELLMNFKNFLISKRVNLKIKNPSLHLLEKDGYVNAGAELAFSLFSTMAKQEIEQKKERFKRAKIRNHKEGKFNGGAETRFGYAVENGYFVVNKEEADIVRLIYEEYATGNYSMQKLATELNKRGIRHRDKPMTLDFLHNVLNDKTYIGESNKMPILDKGLYDKVAQIRANQTSTLLSKESKTIHLATKLLKCKECGSNYIANFDRYVCYKHRFSKRFPEACDNDLTIRIDLLDSLLWEIAFDLHKKYLSVVDEAKVEELDREIAVLGQKQYEIINKIEFLKVRKERVANLYLDGITNDEQYNNAINKIKIELAYCNDETERYAKQIEKYRDMADMLRHPEKQVPLEITEQADKKQIVNKHISEVYIWREERMVRISINGYIDLLYNPYSKKKTDYNIFCLKSGRWVGKGRY